MYKNLFALPNLRPYRPTKHKNRIIPAVITGRIFSLFLLLYYTPNSLCWLDGGPPPLQKRCIKSCGGPSESCLGVRTPQWLRPCLEAGFTENDFVNATKKILRTRTQPRTFPQGPGPGLYICP